MRCFMKYRGTIDSRIDYSLILPVFFLLVVGIISLYIAVSQDYPANVLQMVGQQVAWIGMGMFAAFLVMFFSTKFLWQVTPFLYVLGLILMALPLFFYNPELVASTGAKNWVTIGNMTLFQPSEFMKIAYIVMLARVIVTFHKHYPIRKIREDFILIGYMILLTVPILLLLAMQKDLGTSLVFAAIFSGMLLLSGVSWKILLPTALTLFVLFVTFMLIFISPGGTTFLYNIGIDTYKINRISAWLDPFKNAQTTTYQQAQSLIAIGSGGLKGLGFNKTNLLIPVRESDMIFTVIGEDFGFIGGTVLIGLYLLFIYRMLRVTLQSNNRYYTYISTGYIMMILFHVFENIGAATGLLPLTGIPLPFISQGGSSMVANLIGVGLVLSMGYQSRLASEKESNKSRKNRNITLRR
ncbi:FtsW/RodA/SpoVE family cell cycle protein [Streptococcus ruminantium]|uniref:FtsW/RodA/SpoVE family cell cycle protein n=1 Tax=Streptococcus ruminantium TaxID=1917441 RepID=A0ABU1B617_9STRE|nr:FtsW/RodA/SpoVE family cell cycle protein [Streptococcus ruminantium]MDQ8759442.1 FtsW/RodA/SpoVE family cell cycle protein [Streptococcus ruminantium]MDQ8765852.1 FtsW/RodA/SpoVE family cell cycle protein [Streptococcus ruminantium]MDQ8769995.1 FtsW/RodA/SpoVE family cell cycle protein [Streptococcus ruminantium]MDQ8775720.1 FtsW/RodA/SpoVE family cell cycle protein [Streptococcus ruminantium]MDQ8779558.1 FtsW/RodA/SpoVE family cell cycle protein [Streptococcus ruminantium]